MASQRRGKAREIVVNASLTACYLLIRELSEERDWELDFSTGDRDLDQLSHAVLDMKSITQPVPVSAGSIELIKLTSESTLTQFFFSKLPPVYATALAEGSPEFRETLDRLYDQIEAAMDAVATSFIERLHELKLFFWET